LASVQCGSAKAARAGLGVSTTASTEVAAIAVVSVAMHAGLSEFHERNVDRMTGTPGATPTELSSESRIRERRPRIHIGVSPR
jgi:hypothetical protein